MQITAEIGKLVDITYYVGNVEAVKRTTGLTDVVMEIYDETRAQDLVNFPDVTMTEIGATGRYYGSFTPDAAGVWTVMVDSVMKPGPLAQTVVVGNYDLDSIETDVAAVQTAVNAVQTAVDDLENPSHLT